MTAESFLLRASVICTILVVLGLFDLPYGYYTFLRLCLCVTAIGIIYFAYDALREAFLWALGAMAILYNPVIPIHLGEKSIWIVLNIFSISFFWALYSVLRYRESKTPGDRSCQSTISARAKTEAEVRVENDVRDAASGRSTHQSVFADSSGTDKSAHPSIADANGGSMWANSDTKGCLVTLAYFAGLAVIGGLLKAAEAPMWVCAVVIMPGQMVAPLIAMWLLGDLKR